MPSSKVRSHDDTSRRLTEVLPSHPSRYVIMPLNAAAALLMIVGMGDARLTANKQRAGNYAPTGSVLLLSLSDKTRGFGRKRKSLQVDSSIMGRMLELDVYAH